MVETRRDGSQCVVKCVGIESDLASMTDCGLTMRLRQECTVNNTV